MIENLVDACGEPFAQNNAEVLFSYFPSYYMLVPLMKIMHVHYSCVDKCRSKGYGSLFMGMTRLGNDI